MLRGLAESILSNPPYSVREWCRFLTKLSRLLNKTDCFQPVSFGTPCNPKFRCRGVSIISFACVMTDSRPLKNSQTAAEGLQSSIFVLQLCLLAEMNSSGVHLNPRKRLQSGFNPVSLSYNRAC